MRGSQSVRQLKETQTTNLQTQKLQREVSDQALMNKWKNSSSQISMRGAKADDIKAHKSSRNHVNFADPLMYTGSKGPNEQMNELVRQKSEVFPTDPSKVYRKNLNKKVDVIKNDDINQRLAKYYKRGLIKQGGRGLTAQTQRKNQHQFELQWKGPAQIKEHNAYIDLPAFSGDIKTNRKNLPSQERDALTEKPTKKYYEMQRGPKVPGQFIEKATIRATKRAESSLSHMKFNAESGGSPIKHSGAVTSRAPAKIRDYSRG